MKVFIGIAIILLVLLVSVTLMFFRKQKKITKKRNSKKVPKYELIETSDDQLYYEYYEPRIIEILPNEEIVEAEIL